MYHVGHSAEVEPRLGGGGCNNGRGDGVLKSVT